MRKQRRRRRIRKVVHRFELRAARRRQTEEGERRVVSVRGVGEEALALEDEELLPREDLEPPLELLGVTPAREVAVVLMAEAAIRRLASDAILLAGEASGLA